MAELFGRLKTKPFGISSKLMLSVDLISALLLHPLTVHFSCTIELLLVNFVDLGV